MGGFGGEELGSQVAGGSFVGVTALAGLAVLELGVGWEKTLMVGRASEGFFATGLWTLAFVMTIIEDIRTGSNVGL
jgi:hypothetical protein